MTQTTKNAQNAQNMARSEKFYSDSGPAPSDPFFTEANLAYVKKSVQELRAGEGTAHKLIETDDA